MGGGEEEECNRRSEERKEREGRKRRVQEQRTRRGKEEERRREMKGATIWMGWDRVLSAEERKVSGFFSMGNKAKKNESTFTCSSNWAPFYDSATTTAAFITQGTAIPLSSQGRKTRFAILFVFLSFE